MLQALRSKAGSLVVKVLFAFLILSFAVWGIGDIFRGRGPDQTVATVGDRTISLQEVDQQFRQDVGRLQQQFGDQIGLGAARQMGLLDRSVDQLVNLTLYDQLAARMGYAPSDEAVAAAIRSEPSFVDPATGQFSRTVFLDRLSRLRMAEATFVALTRADMARRAMIEAVAFGAGAPAPLVDAVYAYRQETRDIETVTFLDTAQVAVASPTEDEIKTYYDAHRDAFLSPEYRALTVATLDADDLMADVTVTADDARAEYERNVATYERPERRSFDQAIAPTEQAARGLTDAVHGGKTLADAVAEGGAAGVTSSPIAETAKTDMPIPALAEAGFALAPGGVTDPVQSPFGWHVLVLTDVKPPETAPFEEVQADIEAALKTSRALDLLYEKSSRFEDALNGGSSLEDASATFGFPVVTVPPIAADGRMQDGSAAPEMTARDAVLTAAFGLAEGGQSPPIPAGEKGYAVVRVDRIEAPAPEPLDTVRDAVVAAWRAEKQAEAAKALAAVAEERLKAGEAAEAVATSLSGMVETRTGVLRASGGAALPAGLTERAFALKPGEVATLATNGARTVLRLVAIHPADATTDLAAKDGIASDITDRMAGDLVQQFDAALRDRFGVSIDRQVLDLLGYEG
jgi:peptidyl-prolyl cis-trans isomerase D